MKDVLQRIQLDLDFLASWMLANAFGFAIGEAIVVFFGGMIYVFGALVLGESAVKAAGETLARAAAITPLGLCLGVGQWLVLRNRLKKAEWWFVATLMGWILAGVVLWALGGTGLAAPIGIGFMGTITDWLIAGASLGVTAGILQMFILPLPGYTKFLWPLLNGLGWAMGLARGVLLVKPYNVFFGAMAGAFGGVFTGIFIHLLPIDSDKETGYFVSTS